MTADDSEITSERQCADDGEGVASGAVAPGRTPHSRRLDNTRVVGDVVLCGCSADSTVVY